MAKINLRQCNCRIVRLFTGIAVLLLFFIIAVTTNISFDRGLHASADSGFYDDSFYLKLSAPDDTKIYYTLNSRIPDENSYLYTEPLLISDASKNENIYSMITDVSFDFRKELLLQEGAGDDYGYKTPENPIDKATVVRAVAIDGSGNRSNVITKVYWVGYSQKEAYNNYNIISVVTDPDNLFSYETGIYVIGHTFDDNYENGKPVTPLSSFFGEWPANYHMRGIESEREAHVTLLGKNRDLILDGSYGIRIQGKNSRGAANKSLNIFARKKYGSSSINGTKIFPDGYAMKSINLNCGGNAIRNKLPDFLISSLAGNLDVSTLSYQPCLLFLDGEFWGLYWLTSRYDSKYFENIYGAYDDDIIEIKTGAVEIGQPEDINVYNEMVDWISSHDMSIPENYNEACDQIDIESCIDYYATEIYIANDDWPHNNTALWRTKNISHGKFSDGKWRWIFFDVNMAMFYIYSRSDWIEYTMEKDAMFASLMRNDGFKQKLEGRLVYLAENNFNPSVIDPFIDEYKTMMTDGMALEFERFYGDNHTIDDFYEECDLIKTFFDQRYQYIIETYGENNP
ncbi:MAG: CotH kinase family protein [Lachnospiraceae bacterium]|nr:CotH kinase family protein [Lachnospiraceae bacterium]